MYFRCADCLASTWVDVIRPDGMPASIDCAQCGRRHVVQPNERLKGTAADHHRLVREFASECNLDPASAYAVLLGTMSPQQAEVLRYSQVSARSDPDDELLRPENAESSGAAAQSAPRATSKRLLPDFDLGFTRAIAAGHLTIQQAMARGDRSAFAVRLVRRHRLPEALAYKVTDNRISLNDALAEHERLKSEVREAEAAKQPRSGVSTLGIAAVIALGVGGAAWATWSARFALPEPTPQREIVVTVPREPAQAAAAPEPAAVLTAQEVRAAATAIETDAMGRVVGIVGPDPASVLLAYCRVSRRLMPLEVTSTAPAVRDARLGVFLDPDDPAHRYAIRIRKDRSTHRWVAQSGGVPLQVITAPELPPQAVRVPVAER